MPLTRIETQGKVIPPVKVTPTTLINQTKINIKVTGPQLVQTETLGIPTVGAIPQATHGTGEVLHLKVQTPKVTRNRTNDQGKIVPPLKGKEKQQTSLGGQQETQIV